MKRLIILLTMVLALLLIVGCGSKTKTVTVDPNPELLAQVDDLSIQVAELEESKVAELEESDAAYQKVVSAQEEVITNLLTDLENAEATAKATVEPTVEPTEEESQIGVYYNPEYRSHVCNYITAANVPVFETRYKANGDLKVNKNGYMVLKKLSVAAVKLVVKDWTGWDFANLRNTGRYQIGDVVCYADNRIQVNGMRVFLIISGPFSRHYINPWAFKTP